MNIASSHVNSINMAERVNGVNMVWQDRLVPQRSYHHGDLRAALVDAGVVAARGGGEAAVGINKLAADVGVSPSAAYRHFPGGLEDLLVCLGDVARQELADRIVLRMAQVRPSRDPRTSARRRFRASGEAYVEYVLDEPGLFQVACRHDRGRSGDADPFGLLEACIDELVRVGELPARRRKDAAAAAWSAVHGVSVLLTEGPLRRLAEQDRQRVVGRTLDMVAAGL
jgi:AcrR family transcriptional regulator